MKNTFQVKLAELRKANDNKSARIAELEKENRSLAEKLDVYPLILKQAEERQHRLNQIAALAK